MCKCKMKAVYKFCDVCGKKWNVSVERENDDFYVCPRCFKKESIGTLQSADTVAIKCL